MEFYGPWRIILAYKTMILILTVTATVAAVGLTYALPAVYEASALVIVRPKEEIKLSPNQGEGKEVLNFPVSHAAPIDAPSKTYMEVIESKAVAEKIVRALNLDAPDETVYESEWERLRDEFKTWLKETIRSTRHIFKYGRVIPATPFERAVEDVHEKLSLEVKKNTYAFGITYASGNPKEAADVANMAAERFLAHSAEAYRNEAQTLREFIEVRLKESDKTLIDARTALRRFKNETEIFSIDGEYKEMLKLISGLELDLEKAETKRAGLLQLYNSANEKVASVDAEIRHLEHAISERKKALNSLPEREKELASLDLAVSVAQDDYEFIKKKYEEYRIQEQTSLAEIRVVSPATVPLYPTKPIKYMYGGLAFLLALVTGIALALFSEYINPRVRSADDLSETLGLPVLAAIPVMKPVLLRRR